MRAILSRRAELRAAGQLERELVTAWRYGTEAMGIGVLHALFRSADRARLVASCDPLPPGAPYTLFRGVRGSGLPRGLSWTPSLSMARYYALLPETGSPSRRVCRTTVHEADVYFFCFCPGLEFVCDAPHEPVLLEEGREVIEANWRRDGLDPTALKILSHAASNHAAVKRQLGARVGIKIWSHEELAALGRM